MIRRSYSLLILTIAFIAFGVSASTAQTVITSGSVETEKDGARVPVAGALVEVYRTDTKSGFPSSKTGKNGNFSFAGFQPGGIYAFSVSAPGFAPTIFTGVRAGQEKLLITMVAGDGKKYTEAEVREFVAQNAKGGGGSGAATGELTAEQKKLKAEEEAKRKEIEDRNAKALKANEVVNRTIKEGNAAFEAKDYDTAIAKFTEGFEVDPTFVGSAPVMLNNRATATRARAVDLYNKNAKNTDINAKVEAFTKVRASFLEAVTLYDKSLTMIRNASAADKADPNIETFRKDAINGAYETIRLSVLTEQVGEGVPVMAATIMSDYIALQADVAKKNEGKLLMADLYRVANESEKAIEAYKAILETSPDNVDALAGAGLSLVNLGYINGDKTKLQEGANLLQKFASLAPDTHKYKPDAVGLIETLKKEQNVTPQKVTTKKKP
jgi:tetratricopeptide (TPR) repeat protein